MYAIIDNKPTEFSFLIDIYNNVIVLQPSNNNLHIYEINGYCVNENPKIIR